MNTWQVTVDLDTARPLGGDDLDLVVDALEAHGAALSWLDVELSISMTIETSGSPTRAGELAVRAATTAVRGAGTDVARWRGVEALTADEADRRLTEPAIPELVGTPEAGQVLGVSRQRIHQLRGRDDFPAPVVVLGTGPLLTRSSVEAFAERRLPKPGRPTVRRVTS